jgi:hypothetical protein
MALPSLDGSDASGFDGFGLDVDAAVANGFNKAWESVEAVGVDAVAGGFGEETGAQDGAVLAEAKLLDGAEESRVELVEGNSKHGFSLERKNRLAYLYKPCLSGRLALAGCGVTCLLRMLKGFRGVLMGLFGELVGCEVIAFAVRGGCGLVGVGCFVVILGGAVVRALRHDVLLGFLMLGCLFRLRWERILSVHLLSAHPPAVDGEDGAGDVIAGGRAEIEGGACEILGLAPACCWDAVEDLAIAGLVGLESFGVGGGEVAGGDGVDLDSLGGPLVGESLGELCDSAFARGVGWDADASLKAEEGSDVDDLATVYAEAAARNHVAGCEL